MEVNPNFLAPCGLYCGVCGVYYATRDQNRGFTESAPGGRRRPPAESDKRYGSRGMNGRLGRIWWALGDPGRFEPRLTLPCGSDGRTMWR